ncbi:hypothetical protein ZWY2020_009402 [Hordeum vulgare]|nr:hypothetical protein ZWY2020_009402 [Hordeum vulgare]
MVERYSGTSPFPQEKKKKAQPQPQPQVDPQRATPSPAGPPYHCAARQHFFLLLLDKLPQQQLLIGRGRPSLARGPHPTGWPVVGFWRSGPSAPPGAASGREESGGSAQKFRCRQLVAPQARTGAGAWTVALPARVTRPDQTWSGAS